MTRTTAMDEMTTALQAEDARQAKLHELLETIREQIRLEVLPEHRPKGLFQNIQDAVYAMRGRTPLMHDAVITSRLAAQPAPPVGVVEWTDENYNRARDCMIEILRGHAWTINHGSRGTQEFDNAFKHAVGILALTAAPPPSTQKVMELLKRAQRTIERDYPNGQLAIDIRAALSTNPGKRVAILKEDRGSHMKTLNKLRAERDAAAAQGDHAAAMKLNDHVLTLKSRSDDFCSEHGRDHMRMRPGNSFPFCQECEREESVVRRAVEAFWQELIEKDDRTSPADRPDMALITREELADFVGRAALALDPKGTS